MRVTVLGLWHLGCVTASCLAEAGHRVVGLDFDAKVVEDLQQGEPPLHEPGLADLIREQSKHGLESNNLPTRKREWAEPEHVKERLLLPELPDCRERHWTKRRNDVEQEERRTSETQDAHDDAHGVERPNDKSSATPEQRRGPRQRN